MRKYQNITLSLPKELIQKVKHIAVERNTSISALLTSLLEELVNREESYQKVYLQHLKLLEEGFDLGTNGAITWRREDLYERK
ncbi:CopG domain protein DNA-binding domain protein [Caldicellulosiruptor saccharolyticus DSM 8903]|uniref:CopG domain protein DNA-binding domain protein n=1 Tax=Caldicellulosiruptor saccharolyticus (strain ATCC 43494 / DSM 8903 / Tp8T 6331) TaxID=351627 RepID=A4XKU8_CALS8|nr:DUF6364 family protein [Caldicellulosiruptor saccharolyticus]ABP67533.1 CopG domain protein DNA-binding domain protein [Caldicellulosiruptor saccharolyticus DSM 8903]